MKKLLQLILLLIVQQVAGSLPDTTFYDTITFETYYKFLEIDTSENCIWQIAKPQKLFLNSAFSGEKAIITDSLNTYPVNNYSFFDLKIGAFNLYEYPWDIGIAIRHKFDTDTLADGLYITESFDNGQTWNNIFKAGSVYWDITPAFESYYIGTLYNGELGYSGRSEGWEKKHFEWYHVPVKYDREDIADTMIIRFNFISDSIDNLKEGWMIDDIQIYSVYRGGSIEEYDRDKIIKVYPNPAKENMTIELDQIYQDIYIETIDLQGNILGSDQYYNVKHIQLPYYNQPKGYFFLKITLNGEIIITKRVILN